MIKYGFGILMIGVFLICSKNTNAQSSKFRALAGGGAPEIIYVGAGYELTNKNLLSISIGTDPANIDRYHTYSIRHQLFFGKSKKFDVLNTWYLGQDVNYYYQEVSLFGNNTEVQELKYLFAGFDFGRYFNLSERSSLAFDLGFSLYISYSKFEGGTKTDSKKPRLGIPTANLQYVYRF